MKFPWRFNLGDLLLIDVASGRRREDGGGANLDNAPTGKSEHLFRLSAHFFAIENMHIKLRFCTFAGFARFRLEP